MPEKMFEEMFKVFFVNTINKLVNISTNIE